MTPEQQYQTMQAAVRKVEDYVVPDEDIAAYLRGLGQPQPIFGGVGNVYKGAGPAVEAFVRLRCTLEFVDTLQSMPGFENMALFNYAHDGSGDDDNPYFLNSERALYDRTANRAYDIALLDTVIVHLSTFVGREEDLLRVLARLTGTGAMVFVSQMGISNETSVESFSQWFYDEERFYVPVKRGLLDGLFRPMLPTGTGDFD